MPRAIPILLLFACLPAHAGQTPWQDIAPDTKARLVSSDVLDAQGRMLIGLELDMPAGVKTYWRVPGETGLPTNFEFSASRGIADPQVHWPYPLIDTKSGYVDFAYYGPTVLPALVRPEPGAQLALSVTLGICSDICVPATADFVLPMQWHAPDAGNGIRLRQAMAQAPLPWDQATPAIAGVTYDGVEERLEVSFTPDSLDPSSVIADSGAAGALFGAPQIGPKPGVLYLPLLGKGILGGLEGQPISFTFMTDGGAYEQVLPIGAALAE